MTTRTMWLAAFVAVIWGLCFVIIQASLPTPAPLLLAGLRAAIGGAVLLAWAVLRRRFGRTRSSEVGAGRREPWTAGLPAPWVILMLAVANATLALGAMYLAAGRAEASVAAILASGQPVVLAAAGWVLFGESASFRAVAGLATAMAGVVLIATTSSGATSPEGVGLALLATAAPAAGTVLMRRLGSSVDLLVVTGAQFLLGGAILLGASAAFEPRAEMTWSTATLFGLLVLGVLGTGVAYVIWFWLLPRVPLARLGAALFLVPVVGVIAGVLTGDRPEPIELVGITAVLASIGLVSARRQRPPGEAPQVGR